MRPSNRPCGPAWKALLPAAAASLAVAVLPSAPAHAQAGLPAPVPRQLTLPADCPLLYPAGGYAPANMFIVRAADDMRHDGARNHDVPYRVYYPVGAPSPAPVVFFNHGGGATSVAATVNGVTKVSVGQQQSECRAFHMAALGYVVFVIGRLPAQNLDGDQRRDCAQAGWLTPQTCRAMTGHFVYGPQNVRFLHQRLAVQPTVLPGMPQLDLNRVVVGGWSGGTTAVLNIAGAPQRIGELSIAPTSIPAVTGFLTDAPRGPVWGGFESVGFQEEAFFNLGARPMLAITGRSDYGGGDESSDAQPASRTMAWLSAQRGAKFVSWTTVHEDDGGPIHGTMNLSNCASASKRQYCQWFMSLTAAYLDSVLRGSVAARSWLESDAYATLTAGAAELHRR